MTRREAREHCFKMLFCQDFYPAEEKGDQLEWYFEAPLEDETDHNGIDVVLHEVTAKDEEKRPGGGIYRPQLGVPTGRPGLAPPLPYLRGGSLGSTMCYPPC